MKSVIVALALAAPFAHALPEFDTKLVGLCRQEAQAAISAKIRDACPGPTFVKDLTDIDDEIYTVDFVRPACRTSGTAELRMPLHEEFKQGDQVLIGKCRIDAVDIVD